MAVEPIWWPQARELRAKGLSFGVIKRLLKRRDHTAIVYATMPEEWRERRRRAGRLRSVKPKHMSPEGMARNRIVKKAHTEARHTGQHIDQVLVAWGELPRRMKQREASAT